MNSSNHSSMGKNLFRDLPFGNTLIVGAGPAAIHVAVSVSRKWSNNIGLLNRKGSHTVRLREELEKNHDLLVSKVQGEKYSCLCGEAKLDYFYEGYDAIDDIWQTIIICTPSDSYRDVINALNVDSLKKVKTIILISPSIGSNLLVTSQLKSSKDRIDVVSLSTYFAATKFEPKNPSILSVFTKALKKRIYIASSQSNSDAIWDVKRFIESLGIQCTVVSNAIEAESKNITTYVHPPFFINEFSLNEILSSGGSKKSMYKIYPEGPITQHSIRAMVLLWKEVSALTQYFGANPLNLLKFLNDDNYPVHDITLSREDIENFIELGEIQQEYLLYIRYTSILIDPFSKPDDNGKYFDFSSVPYKQVYKDKNGKWVLPRIPFEDYKKMKLIYGLAQKVDIPMPQTLDLINHFERRLNEFIKEKGEDSFYPEVFVDTTQSDVDAIFNEMGRGK
ncbi:opine metallophore biosynthesis dehydrogenase [Priestia abyssalis]|uniref:opine metallophore biosynthesis dehydrogenase n=1 Tax=Priestia abyssalis TaxID=1221450 RepID=UPI001F18E767|nr:opine metallophore biosynthesis dehydrogenase [Priestia abyssalis]